MKEILRKIKNLFQKAEEVAPAAVEEIVEEDEYYTLEDGYTHWVEPDWTEEEKRSHTELMREFDIRDGKWGMFGKFSICGALREQVEIMQYRKEQEAEYEEMMRQEEETRDFLKRRISEYEARCAAGILTQAEDVEWQRLEYMLDMI